MSVHLVGNYRSERCLTEAGRTIQKNMVEGLAALTRGLNRDLQVLFNALLSDVFRKDARAKRQFECCLFLRHRSRNDSVRHTSKGELATKGTKRLINSQFPILNSHPKRQIDFAFPSDEKRELTN